MSSFFPGMYQLMLSNEPFEMFPRTWELVLGLVNVDCLITLSEMNSCCEWEWEWEKGPPFICDGISADLSHPSTLTTLYIQWCIMLMAKILKRLIYFNLYSLPLNKLDLWCRASSEKLCLGWFCFFVYFSLGYLDKHAVNKIYHFGVSLLHYLLFWFSLR